MDAVGNAVKERGAADFDTHPLVVERVASLVYGAEEGGLEMVWQDTRGDTHVVG